MTEWESHLRQDWSDGVLEPLVILGERLDQDLLFFNEVSLSSNIWAADAWRNCINIVLGEQQIWNGTINSEAIGTAIADRVSWCTTLPYQILIENWCRSEVLIKKFGRVAVKVKRVLETTNVGL